MLAILRNSFVLALCAALAACGAPPRDRHVQPQRPTFGSDTRTTPQDVLEVEGGFAFDPGDPGDDFETPVLLKLGLGPRTELFGGMSLLRVVDGEGGIGDALVGVRHRLWDETYERPATAFQFATKLPSADEEEGLGSGELDFFAAGIHTRTIDRTAFTLFYQLGLVGDQTDAGQDVELAVSGAVDTDLTTRLAGFGELTGILRPEDDSESLFLTVGTTFRYAPWMYVDVGLAVGLTGDVPDVLLLLGLTRSVGRVLGFTEAPTPGRR